jgi:hypothetical protein
VNEHVLFLDLSMGPGGQFWKKMLEKYCEYLNCILGFVWVELRGHAGEEERTLCFKNGLLAVSASAAL